MTCPQVTVPDPIPLADRLVESALQTLEIFGVYLGRRLGLYEVLADGRRRTPDELAASAGIDARYAREWLEQQAVAGLLEVDQTGAEPSARRYLLPAAHRAVLVDEDDPAFVAPLSEMIAGIAGVVSRLPEAYRTGAGIPYACYGDDFRRGQGGINRPAFLHDLPRRWLPAMPEVHARLRRTRGARIVDLGCGVGWSTIALARAYPHAVVLGYDPDPSSIREAQRHAAAAGVRARFVCGGTSALAEAPPADLVVVLEALHDMARPAEELAAVRRSLAEDGTVLVADERVADRFGAPGDPVERLMYGWSIVHCLPAARCEAREEATGTVLRAEVVQAMASRAGFARCEILDVDHDFLRLYRLDNA